MEFEYKWRNIFCDKIGHENVQLNMICFECDKSFICAECFQESHFNHINRTMSLQKFIEQISKKNFENCENPEILEKIEQKYIEIEFIILQTKKSMNQYFDDLQKKFEIEHKKFFDQIRLSNQNVNIINDLDDLKKFCSSLNISLDDNKNIVRKIKKVSDNLENLEDFKQILNKNSEEIKKFCKELFVFSFEKEEIQFRFSEIMKNEQIFLFNNNKNAKKLNENSQTVALINHKLSNFEETLWKIQCVNLSSWIGIGVGIKEILQKNNYKTKEHGISSGLFLYSYNGYTWSHKIPNENSKEMNFKISNGDIVEIKYTKKQNILEFFFENKKIAELTKIKENNKEIYPVVFMYGENDEVKIIDNE